MTFTDDIAPHQSATPAGAGRGFSAEEGSVEDAIDAVRALDADAYRELLEALGLTPDPRLSIPGCAPRRR
jgi:hypothetical protein